MLLFEITENRLFVKLIALVSDIKHSLEHDTHRKSPWMNNVDEFLDYLADHDIIIDRGDFIDMIKNERGPLSSVISNVQGDEIVWRDGDENSDDIENAATDAEIDQQTNQDIVSGMAQKALSNS